MNFCLELTEEPPFESGSNMVAALGPIFANTDERLIWTVSNFDGSFQTSRSRPYPLIGEGRGIESFTKSEMVQFCVDVFQIVNGELALSQKAIADPTLLKSDSELYIYVEDASIWVFYSREERMCELLRDAFTKSKVKCSFFQRH
jgi:hypothetical protein